MSRIPPEAIQRLDPYRVRLAPWRDDMRGEGRVYANEALFGAIMADGTLLQVSQVAALPGLLGPSIAMPDAHQGYGFPIGGVAATDAENGGVVSPGGVGFDINCGVRLLSSDLDAQEVTRRIDKLMDELMERVPTGFSKARNLTVQGSRMDDLLREGAAWAVGEGYGRDDDVDHVEARGALAEARPDRVSNRAKDRGEGQLGTLGSGNHFIEVQRVDHVEDAEVARAFGLEWGQTSVLIHTGSRGLGHQVCSEYLVRVQKAMQEAGLHMPDRQLACTPVHSEAGQAYLGAMSAAANFAWANRQVLTAFIRRAFTEVFGHSHLGVVYDVAHNIARLEEHSFEGSLRKVVVHRKGATRAFPAGHPDLPDDYRDVGQPVFIPGSMGTASYVLVGTPKALEESWGSVCHGAGRSLSRGEAKRTTTASEVKKILAARGVTVRAASKEGLVEEAPEAYKDVSEVVDTVVGAGLARVVARLKPIGVLKG